MTEYVEEIWTCGNCQRQHHSYDPSLTELFCNDCDTWTREPRREHV